MFKVNLFLLHVEPQASSWIQFWSSTDRQNKPLANFQHFSCFFAVLIMRNAHVLWRGEMFIFQKQNISKYNKFVFQGQVSLKIIAELLKNEPLLLKRLV